MIRVVMRTESPQDLQQLKHETPQLLTTNDELETKIAPEASAQSSIKHAHSQKECNKEIDSGATC